MGKSFFVPIFIAAACSAFGLDFDGAFSTETRVGLVDGDYLFNQENGTLTFEQKVDDNLFARASMRFRYFNSPIGMQSGTGVLSPAELSILSAVGPVEISLDEAFAVYTDFLFPGFDLTVGKQRIPWGTADVLNPTDVLNAGDFSDPFDFGKKIPGIALTLTYTIPGTDVFFLLVAEPFSQVARLNPMMTSEMEAALIFPPVITGVASGSGEVQTPDANLSGGLLAMKLGFQVAGFDISLSYVNRTSDMPIPTDLQVAGGPGTPVTSYTLSYYREQMAGMDLVKDWGIFLSWLEVAVFFQNDQDVSTTITGFGTSKSVALSSDPYVKYTVGVDKDFGSGFYMNFQYAHGFFSERGNEGSGRLQDYFLLRLQLDVLDQKLTFGLTGLLNINTIADAFGASNMAGFLADNHGFMAGIDAEYKPSLSLSIKLGVMVFDGNDASHIGKMDGYDMFFIKAEYKF